MNILSTKLDGVYLINLERKGDARGNFTRIFCESELADVLEGRQIVQANYSSNVNIGVVRGMHYQIPPHAEMKLITCVGGCIWDVIVDLRIKSPTYLSWISFELSGENEQLLVIPEGCAHGYQVLSPQSNLIYFHTNAYCAEAEGGVRYDDPILGITWPLPVLGVSLRDLNHPLIGSKFTGLMV